MLQESPILHEYLYSRNDNQFFMFIVNANFSYSYIRIKRTNVIKRIFRKIDTVIVNQYTFTCIDTDG
ncbi:hypothetical protein BANRA_03113 [Klebsiella pneumoniae]|nr:hypothetical protein BANRA_03113 [Klebsiella pneumoniae]